MGSVSNVFESKRGNSNYRHFICRFQLPNDLSYFKLLLKWVIGFYLELEILFSVIVMYNHRPCNSHFIFIRIITEVIYCVYIEIISIFITRCKQAIQNYNVFMLQGNVDRIRNFINTNICDVGNFLYLSYNDISDHHLALPTQTQKLRSWCLAKRIRYAMRKSIRHFIS